MAILNKETQGMSQNPMPITSFFGKLVCPDCDAMTFLEGPHGGLSVNVKCENCGSEFNVCMPFFVERIHSHERSR